MEVYLEGMLPALNGHWAANPTSPTHDREGRARVLNETKIDAHEVSCLSGCDTKQALLRRKYDLRLSELPILSARQ